MTKTTFGRPSLWPALLLCIISAVSSAGTAAPRQPAQPHNPAALSLLESAARDLDAGRLEQAAAALERAQRIEPGNAVIWHYLGLTRLHQGEYQEAQAMAAKSDSLAGDDATLRSRNAWLADVARRAANHELFPRIDDSEQLAQQQRLDEESEGHRQAEVPTAARLGQREQASAAELEWARDESRPERNLRPVLREASLDAGQARDVWQIPRGHRPPPGQCRIWFPDRSPGQQPPPGDCRALELRLPAGAWLLRS